MSRSERDCVGADDGAKSEECALIVDDRPGVTGRRTTGDVGARNPARAANANECSGEEDSDDNPLLPPSSPTFLVSLLQCCSWEESCDGRTGKEADGKRKLLPVTPLPAVEGERS